MENVCCLGLTGCDFLYFKQSANLAEKLAQAANEQVFYRMLRLNCKGTKYHKTDLIVFSVSELVMEYDFDSRNQICATIMYAINLHDMIPKIFNVINTISSSIQNVKPFKSVHKCTFL